MDEAAVERARAEQERRAEEEAARLQIVERVCRPEALERRA